jgi:hypothetical protein
MALAKWAGEEVETMRFDIGGILLIVAVILFVLAAIGIALGNLDLVTLGLAFFAASFLFGGGGFSLRR